VMPLSSSAGRLLSAIQAEFYYGTVFGMLEICPDLIWS